MVAISLPVCTSDRRAGRRSGGAPIFCKPLEGRFAARKRIPLGLDRFITSAQGAFYTTFKAARVRDLVRRGEFCRTLKHGSGPHAAENQPSST